ncbi:hypothetical protein [Arcanobacterium phocae]|uniref:hypothetical protein n=1 Tax=Arcanobacterium phocae TaxID=131112 RepID=UPI001C0EA58A|nr:hypothetical protein [Arcanobacterium phocae]
MQIIPGLPVVWRETDQLQIGLDPRTGIVLSGLTKNERTFVDSLSVPQSDFELASRVKRLNLASARVKEIISMLTKAHVLTTSDMTIPDATSGVRLHGSVPDRRSNAHIVFVRGDYVSMVAALIISDAGIGHITCRDSSAVAHLDHPRLATRFTGLPRYLAWDNVFHNQNHQSLASFQPTAVVISHPYVINPATTAGWLTAGTPIVHVCTEEVDLVVGPTTIPHISACSSCVYLHHVDADKAWQRLAMQVFGRSEVLADISSMELAGAYVAREILALVDQQKPSLFNALIRIGPQPRLPLTYQVLPHPDCGCQAELTASDTGTD